MKEVKDVFFYNAAIRRNSDFIVGHEKELQNYKGEVNDIFLSSRLAYFVWHLNNIIASYSKGSTKEELRSQFSEAVKVMAEVWDRRITKVYHGKKSMINIKSTLLYTYYKCFLWLFYWMYPRKNLSFWLI
jgi:hypothetical protein